MIRNILLIFTLLSGYTNAFLNSCMPNVCIIKTGCGDPNLLPVITKRLLSNDNAIAIYSDEVSRDIVSLINCHTAIKESNFDNNNDELLSYSASCLLNHHPIYRILPYNKDISLRELNTYKKWGLEITIIPGISDTITNY
jgi:siroheme synthase